MTECYFNKENVCVLASEIAKTSCTTNSSICAMCQECDRPKRLNIYTAGLILQNDPSQNMDSLVKTMLGTQKGFGSTLAAMFKPFFQELPNCECPGHEDILNTWTKEYIQSNLETVIRWLQTEAYRRSVPFSPMLTRLLLKSLLLVS